MLGLSFRKINSENILYTHTMALQGYHVSVSRCNCNAYHNSDQR